LYSFVEFLGLTVLTDFSPDRRRADGLVSDKFSRDWFQTNIFGL
jgi:hypothetical protein